MTLVHVDHRVSPAAQAKISELELVLAMTRTFVENAADDPDAASRFQDFAKGVLARIDRVLDGSIHSFTPNGSVR